MARRKPARTAADRREPAAGSGGHAAARPGAALACLAAAWIALAFTELGLSAAIPATSLRNGDLAIGARAAIAAFSLAALAAGVGLVGAIVLALSPLRRPASPAFVRRPAAAAQALVVGIAVLLYASSWALFWNTGVFIDRQAFAFLALNGLQVYHWVYPPLAAAVLIAACGGTFFLGHLLPVWTARLAAAPRRGLVRAAAGAFTVCVAAAPAGGLVYGSPPADANQPKSDYTVSRDDDAGPAAHAIADAVRSIGAASEAPAAASIDDPNIVRRPIVSMQQYLAGVHPAETHRWNVVMVQVESLRSDQLRAYGGTKDVMPAVDALARESRVFTNAYIQASHSNYADLVPLSSQYPLRSPQMYEYPHNPPYPRVLIYDVLKAVGYKTAIFSSQNESWGGMTNFHRMSSLDRFFDPETFDGPTYAPYGDTGFAEWVKQTKGAGSVDDRYTVDAAIKWIDGLGGQPFFLHMNLQSSHVPYVVPAGFKRHFSPDTIDFPIMWAKFPADKVDVVKGRYEDSLFYEDTQIERLFDDLRSRGEWDNTLLVVGGDNGEAFYEHGFASHASSLFNEVVKVPMIIRVPGLAAGADQRPAMFLDVPPSLLDVLGLPAHPGFQGISLFAPHPDPDRSLFTIVQTPAAFQSAIIRSGMKLLYNEFDGKYFLYDQVNDPGETHNLRAARPDLVQDLDRRLRLWRQEQLAYYADAGRESREYPPVFRN